jgi:DNA invertase Pin-like site-specific DNA recombinase
MKAVIYARYSTHSQTEQSIEGQLRVCYEYAEKHDLTVVGTYIDRAVTGKTDEREQFQKMLKDSDRRLFEAVIVYNYPGKPA